MGVGRRRRRPRTVNDFGALGPRRYRLVGVGAQTLDLKSYFTRIRGQSHAVRTHVVDVVVEHDFVFGAPSASKARFYGRRRRFDAAGDAIASSRQIRPLAIVLAHDRLALGAGHAESMVLVASVSENSIETVTWLLKSAQTLLN